MMTTVDSLLNSGLPITWTTLRIAYNRFSNPPTPVPNLLTEQQILAYAMDQIGYGQPEQAALIAELAFADERDTWTIQRCLEELALSTPEEIQCAVRTWRWVLLSEAIAELEQMIHARPSESTLIYGVWTDDFRTSVYCVLRDYWEKFESPPQGFVVCENWSEGDWLRDIPSTLRLIEEHRSWLTQEEAEIRAQTDR